MSYEIKAEMNMSIYFSLVLLNKTYYSLPGIETIRRINEIPFAILYLNFTIDPM